MYLINAQGLRLGSAEGMNGSCEIRIINLAKELALMRLAAGVEVLEIQSPMSPNDDGRRALCWRGGTWKRHGRFCLGDNR